MIPHNSQSPLPDPQVAIVQQEAFDALFVELETQLRKKASILCRQERSPSFNTGDLLGDLYLRLKKNPAYALAIAAQGYPQFLAIAAKAMQHILADAGRRRRNRNTFLFVSLSHVDDRRRVSYSPENLIALDECLRSLEQSRPRQVTTIRLRFYLGFSINEIREYWGLSDATVENDIRTALQLLSGILKTEA